MKESAIQQLIRLEASRLGAIVWRNNQGAYKQGNNFIRYGVCNPGGSDLIGIYKGKFLAMEIKIPGKNATPEQQLFIDIINKNGGIAGVVRCVADVQKLLA